MKRLRVVEGGYGSKRLGLAPPIGIVVVILMRQDTLVWVGLKAPDTAKPARATPAQEYCVQIPYQSPT